MANTVDDLIYAPIVKTQEKRYWVYYCGQKSHQYPNEYSYVVAQAIVADEWNRYHATYEIVPVQ